MDALSIRELFAEFGPFDQASAQLDRQENRATVVLPSSGFAEKRGSMINLKGRLQRLNRAVELPGQARDAAAERRFRVDASQAHRVALLAVGVSLAADDSGRYIAASDALCALTGYSQDELLDMYVWDLSITRNLEKDQRTWRQFLRVGGFVGEYHLRRKSDETIRIPCIAVADVVPGLHVAAMASRRAR